MKPYTLTFNRYHFELSKSDKEYEPLATKEIPFRFLIIFHKYDFMKTQKPKNSSWKICIFTVCIHGN